MKGRTIGGLLAVSLAGVLAASVSACPGTGETGYLWTKALDGPFPRGVNQTGALQSVRVQPDNVPVRDGTFFCGGQHDNIVAYLQDPPNATSIETTDYNNAVGDIDNIVVAYCSAVASDNNITFNGGAGQTNCSEAANQNTDIDQVLDPQFNYFQNGECDEYLGGGDEGDQESEMKPRAAGPSNYGLTTFDDVFDCNIAGDECDIDSDFVDDLIDDTSGLYDDSHGLDIGSVNLPTGGTVDGVKLTTVGTSSLLDYLGFSQNDVITEINGDTVDTLDNAWGAVARHFLREHIEIDYFDGSSYKTLTLEVVNLRTYP